MYFIRPDMVYRSGAIRPNAANSDLLVEVNKIARDFTRTPNSMPGSAAGLGAPYGFATTPRVSFVGARPFVGFGRRGR